MKKTPSFFRLISLHRIPFVAKYGFMLLLQLIYLALNLTDLKAQDHTISIQPVSKNDALLPPLNVCRNGLNILILSFGTYYDSVNVWLGNGCTVTDIDIRIDTVLYGWDSDLRFYIRKSTVGVKIIDRVGGAGDNFIGTILDDEATIPIANGMPPFTGSFLPSNPLTPFDGISPNGYWKIVITDTAGGDTGVLKAWCVVITYICPTGIIKTVEVPNYYFLEQNYPNPFNSATIIKFGIPRAENVNLVVYDITGKKVKTLVDEEREPGTYEVRFAASELASGIYYYELETPNFKKAKQIVIIK